MGLELELVTVENFDCKKLIARTLVIVDEADNCILDQMMKIPKGQGLLIGFTATAFRTKNGTEENYLASLGF